ncbi:MAG: imelysin family protein [Bacteroidota bacterium]
MRKSIYLLVFCAGVIFFSACSKAGDNDAAKKAVIQDYATLVSDSYQAALADAQSLKTAINNFVANPTQETFDNAKKVWLEARESYGPTEAYRFAGGPIDIINGEEGPEGLLNSWPLDENYIDYTTGEGSVGIINDLENFPTINKAALEAVNTEGGEENVSIGYHAIEFLLWGQDNTAPATLQAGQRPYTDFVDEGTAPNADRRRQYLQICADLIIDHLQILVDQWKEDGSYRKTFLALEPEAALSKMLTAIATLSKSELAGERMFTPYDNQDQEDEHSCFSDNTHRDIRVNFDGIKHVYLAINGTNTGNSMSDLVKEADPTVAATVLDQLTATEQAVYATGIPFDHAIVDAEERKKVLAAVNALRKLGNQFAAAGAAIGIEVSTQLK